MRNWMYYFPSILFIFSISKISSSITMTLIHIGSHTKNVVVTLPKADHIYIVLFKFRSEVTQENKQTFVTELKKLKALPCVKDGRLIVGGPSVTDPIDRSKGFEIALLSYHENQAALAEYQASDEHHRYDFDNLTQRYYDYNSHI